MIWRWPAPMDKSQNMGQAIYEREQRIQHLEDEVKRLKHGIRERLDTAPSLASGGLIIGRRREAEIRALLDSDGDSEGGED